MYYRWLTEAEKPKWLDRLLGILVNVLLIIAALLILWAAISHPVGAAVMIFLFAAAPPHIPETFKG